MDLRTILHHMMTTRYARELESEVSCLCDEIKWERGENARLRAENRALLNSILGIAGIPPVIVPAVNIPDVAPELSGAAEAASESAGTPPKPREKGKGSGIPPLRRRSWQQVMRGLELAAARKPLERESP